MASPSDAAMDSALDLLQRLVSIPSLSGEEGRASRALAEWMSRHGFEAQVDEVGNAVGVRGQGENEILLLGHIDTFPGEVPLRREGDLLYGRGSVDAKGPLCAFAAAAAGVEVKEGWKITVVGAVEEEASSSRGARHVLSLRQSAPPRFCVIGEPSRWDRITLGYKGCLRLDLSLEAPLAHSAGPSPLPAERGLELWALLRAVCESLNKARQARRTFEQLDSTLQAICSRRRGAFGEVELEARFRLPLWLTPADLKQRIVDHLQGWMDSQGGRAVAVQAGESVWESPCPMRLRAVFQGGESAHLSDKSGRLVAAFLNSIRQAGGDPRFVVKTGTSDMNVVAPAWPSTPIVAYGPGDSQLDHTPDEHLSLEEYRQAIQVEKAALRLLMGS